MPLDERDPELIERAFEAPLDIPQKWLSWLISYIESHPPVLPVSQVFGFQSYADAANTAVATAQAAAATAQAAADASAKVYGAIVATAESLAGVTSYSNLTTTGPQLTGLPNGQYLLLYGAIMEAVAGGAPTPSPHRLSVDVNGGGASDNDSTWHRNGTESSVVIGVLKTLSGGSNSVTLKYRCIDASNGTWQQRWLIAVKYSN